MAELVRHRQTKESATDRLRLNHRATPRLHISEVILCLSGLCCRDLTALRGSVLFYLGFRRPEIVRTYSPKDQENSPASRSLPRQTFHYPLARRFLRLLLPSRRSLSLPSSIRMHSCLSEGAVGLRVAPEVHHEYLQFQSASSRSAGLSVS